MLTPAGLDEFRRLFVPRDYEQAPKRPRRFVDPKSAVNIDVLVTGKFPGSGEPGPVAFPDPGDVAETIDEFRVIDLPNLIQLKLAARRHRDLGDVVELIRFNNLEESFATKLHPSLRRDYLECLDEKRREDDYETRQD